MQSAFFFYGYFSLRKSPRLTVGSPCNPFKLCWAQLLLHHSHLLPFSHLCSYSAADRAANHTHGRDGQHITFGLFPLIKASAYSKQWQTHQPNCPHTRRARLFSCWMSKANWVMVQKLILRRSQHSFKCKSKTCSVEWGWKSMQKIHF